MEKIAVLGIHHESLRLSMKMFLDDYKVYEAKTLEEMVEVMKRYNLPRDVETPDLYLMDVNLGFPDSPRIDSGEKIYNLVKDYVNLGKAKFLSITGNDEALELAVKYNIPCVIKEKFSMLDL